MKIRLLVLSLAFLTASAQSGSYKWQIVAKDHGPYKAWVQIREDGGRGQRYSRSAWFRFHTGKTNISPDDVPISDTLLDARPDGPYQSVHQQFIFDCNKKEVAKGTIHFFSDAGGQHFLNSVKPPQEKVILHPVAENSDMYGWMREACSGEYPPNIGYGMPH